MLQHIDETKPKAYFKGGEGFAATSLPYVPSYYATSFADDLLPMTQGTRYIIGLKTQTI